MSETNVIYDAWVPFFTTTKKLKLSSLIIFFFRETFGTIARKKETLKLKRFHDPRATYVILILPTKSKSM